VSASSLKTLSKKTISRRSLIATSLGSAALLPALARADDTCANRPNTAPALQPPLLLSDWAWLAHFREDNAKLLASGEKIHAVFMGDSITEGWARMDPVLFSNGIVGRGISAQTTPQMLVRMHQDVIALKPRIVHIMAGTNDIAGNTGPMSADDTKNNFMAMCEIAMAHKVRIVLGASPPASKYGWKPELQPHESVLALNEWLRAYAKKIHARFVDYAAALSDGQGGVRLDLAKDQVHPTAEGYAAMRRLVETAIR
jgi:lysophospholipase L1-like esterase